MRILLIVVSMVLSSVAMAKGGAGSGFSLGANIGITASSQSDMDTLISRANTRSAISTGSMGNAWEFNGYVSYRTSTMLALQFRPSYFYSATDGSGATGDHDYSVTGFTLFPIFRFYLLESQTVRFFTQLGIGWGFVSGEIKEGTASLKFSGNNMGSLAGLGAEFCFGSHCVAVEGNFRYLGYERLIADSSSGTFDSSGTPSLSQGTSGQEVELDSTDLSVSMSGVQGFVGYVFYF